MKEVIIESHMRSLSGTKPATQRGSNINKSIGGNIKRMSGSIDN